MDSVIGDLRYALGHLRRRPGFAALAVLTLAIGIGVNTVAFTAVNALLFHPFVFKGVERLGWIMLATPGNPHGDMSFGEFGELKRQARAFQTVAAEGRMPLALIDQGRAEQVWTLLVSDGYFQAIGATPLAGRVLDATDAARDDVAAVVSETFWKTRLNGQSIAGRTLTIANRTVAVVGVLPDNYRGPGGLFAPDVWLPLERAEALGVPRAHFTGGDRWLTVIGRLAERVSAPQAEHDLALVAPSLPTTGAQSGRDRRLGFFPMREGHPEVRGLAPYVWIAMSIVGLVLLIACFNVAALLFARAAERRREIGIRTALGASRGRIVRQLVTEGLVLAALSGAASLVLAAWSGRLLAAFSLPAPIPQRLALEIDGRLVLFTAAMVLVAGVLPGLLPALQITRRSLVSSMRLEGIAERKPSRTRGWFVGAQVAGSTLFLALALLFVRSFWNANAVDVGLEPAHLTIARLQPSLYGFEGARAESVVRDIAARVAATPGVTVSIADRAPFAVGYPNTSLVSTDAIDCVATPCKPVTVYAVDARHFEALGVAMRAGRDFTALERKSGGAVIINDALAARLWPDRSAINETVRLGRERTPAQVVGVVGNVAIGYLGQPASAALYVPMRSPDFEREVSMLVRSGGADAAAIAAIKDAAHAVAPAMPLASVTPMEDLLAVPVWPRRTAAGFFLICGALALILATIGLFGVTYVTVRQRTREFGIRIAIGARSTDVVRLVLKEGLWLAGAGAAAGLVLASIAGRLTARMLLGVSPADPASFAATAGIELLVALLACALPARRATQADPMLALRDDN